MKNIKKNFNEESNAESQRGFMTLSERTKNQIKRIIDESVTTNAELIAMMNRFFADTNDAMGIIGWNLLNQLAENNQNCRAFISTVPDEFEIHNEIGEYVKAVIERKLEIQ